MSGVTFTLPTFGGPAAAPASGGVPMLQVPEGIPVDVTSNLVTAPESKTAIRNAKSEELKQAQATMAALGQSIMVAQRAITYWVAMLLSENSTVREDANAKMMGQNMHIQRLLPQLTHQQHLIARLQKDIQALDHSIANWPANAGLVGGYGGGRAGGAGVYRGGYYQAIRQPFQSRSYIRRF